MRLRALPQSKLTVWSHQRPAAVRPPRGRRWSLGGVRFGALGGAYSIDKQFLFSGYWHQHRTGLVPRMETRVHVLNREFHDGNLVSLDLAALAWRSTSRYRLAPAADVDPHSFFALASELSKGTRCLAQNSAIHHTGLGGVDMAWELLQDEDNWMGLVLEECPIPHGPCQGLIAMALAPRLEREGYMKSETASIPDTRDRSVVIIARTNIFINIEACKDFRFETLVLYANSILPGYRLDVAALAAAALKVFTKIKLLTEDEGEIIRRIARASNGDLYVRGAHIDEVVRMWPGDPEELRNRLRSLQLKGVLTVSDGTWTILR